MNKEQAKTLGELKSTNYTSVSLKNELRNNLIKHIQSGENRVFEGIIGFEDTVIPDLERAILSRHNILLLGLRGQAKTKIARLMVNLLDEHIPIVQGSEMNDDPLHPISKFARDLVAKKGDETPIEWIHRDERYVEKLATPDVSVADLIGDVDPIKAATLKLPYSDERVIHLGLVPRAHRSIFVINELPDLQPRIQVSLFNILQEGDLQIRGFKLRLPLDVQFVFTANPEDYTSRGSIITPLKDRIESQILTHYPKDLKISKSITENEANLAESQKAKISVPDPAKFLIERTVFSARNSEFVDEKSGVSARMSITAFENLISTAERRMIINKEEATTIRVGDFWGIIPAITGKVELEYEGEQEGHYTVALKFIEEAVKQTFLESFPNPEKLNKGEERDPYGTIKAWFEGGNQLSLLNDETDEDFRAKLDAVAGLEKLVSNSNTDKNYSYFYKELVLHALSSLDIIQKDFLEKSLNFRDPLADIWKDFNEE